MNAKQKQYSLRTHTNITDSICSYIVQLSEEEENLLSPSQT